MIGVKNWFINMILFHYNILAIPLFDRV